MTTRVYYATHSTASYTEGRVVLFDDEIPEEWGLANSGYFEQIVTPEVQDDAPEDQDRTG